MAGYGYDDDGDEYEYDTMAVWEQRMRRVLPRDVVDDDDGAFGEEAHDVAFG